MPELLAVSAVPPRPLRGGFSLRAAHLLDALARDWRISLVVAGPEIPLRDAVAAEIAKREFRVALLWPGTESLAFGLRAFPPAVADRVDCVTLERLRALPRRPATLGRVVAAAVYERRVARSMGATVVAGEDDADALRKLSGSDRVVVIPNGVDAYPTPCFEAQHPEPTVVFSGTLNYYANGDAAAHFARRLWPRIRQAIPNARFLIVGRTPGRGVLGLAGAPGVEVRSEVADMASALQEAWVAVAPMRLGTGVKNKVLEAWAVGRPVVMTPIAANGLHLDTAMLDLVTNRWDRFGELVVQLLHDPNRRQSIGAAALSLVRARHSWDESGSALSRLLREVSAGPSADR